MDIGPQLELRHLRYFVAVAEALSFSRAAERLHMAQPPLSQQIRKLEELLRCELFDRSRRRVRLTPAGEILLPEARRLLADAAATAALVRRIGRGEVGTLTIGFTPSTLFSPLPRAVREFRERAPGVRVRLLELSPSEHLEALRSGRVDVEVVREPEAADDIRVVPMLTEGFVAAVPAGHPLARRRSIRAAALRAEPFVLFPREIAPGLHRQVLEVCREAGFEPGVVQEADEWQTILSLVEAGIGVSIIPESFRGRRTGDLTYLELTGATPRTVTAACCPALGRSRTTQRFLEVVRSAGREGEGRPAGRPT